MIDEWEQQPNRFESIDPEIDKFYKEYNLPFMKVYKDYRVRIFQIDQSEIHIKAPDATGNVSIYLQSKKNTSLFYAKKGNVYATLKHIYQSLKGKSL